MFHIHLVIQIGTSKLSFDPVVLARGGTDLERGYGDVRPWRLPFHASPAVCKGPISSKRVSSQDPLLRKFGNFSLYSLNFRPNFSSQAPKFGNYKLTSPRIWKFSVHKPPNLEIFSSQAPPPFSKASISSQAPHFGNPGRTPLPEKVECSPPPRGSWQSLQIFWEKNLLLYFNNSVVWVPNLF